MKKTNLLLLLLLLNIGVAAQDTTNLKYEMPKNSVNGSFLGDASIISISYERLFPINPNLFFTGKIGVGYNEDFQFELIKWEDSNSSTNKHITISHHITSNFGKKKYYFECGLGGTIIGGNTNYNYLLYPIVGYRLQPLKSNKVNFRVYSCIPVTPFKYTNVWFSPIAISVGYSF